MVKYNCEVCKKEFAGYGKRPARFCSRQCTGISNRGKALWPNGREMPWMVGKRNYGWKGEKVGYHALHAWVMRYKGRPTRCVHCGVTSEQKRLQWANISKEYRRDLEDYFALCSPCHQRFDYKPETGQKISMKNKGNRIPNAGSFKKGNAPPAHKAGCVCRRCFKKVIHVHISP